jgi:hypothetical protein
MAVHPIEERYGTKEMRAVWSEQNRFSCIVKAEIALAKAEAVCGMIPPTAACEIEANAPAAGHDGRERPLNRCGRILDGRFPGMPEGLRPSRPLRLP